MTNFLDTKSFYHPQSVSKEFWEKFKNDYKVYSQPAKIAKPLKVSVKPKSSAPTPYQSGFSFNMNMQDNGESETQDKLMQVNLEKLQSW